MTALTLETKLNYEILSIPDTNLEVLIFHIHSDPLKVFKHSEFYVLNKVEDREKAINSLYGNIQDQQSLSLTRTGIYGRSMKYLVMLESELFIDSLIKNQTSFKELQHHSLNNMQPAHWKSSAYTLDKLIQWKQLRPYLFSRKDGDDNLDNVPHILNERHELSWFEITYFSSTQLDKKMLGECFAKSPIAMIIEEKAKSENLYIYRVTTEQQNYHLAHQFLMKLYQEEFLNQFTSHHDVFTVLNLYLLSLMKVPQTLNISLTDMLETQFLSTKNEQRAYPLLCNSLCENKSLDNVQNLLRVIESHTLQSNLSMTLSDKEHSKKHKI